MDPHPIQLVVEDDLRRSRLTVLFRLVLAIPHLIWLVLWSLVVSVAAIAGWLVALVLGRLPAGLHRFFCAYIRYVTHLTAYMCVLANPYPPFTGAEGGYPVDVRLPEPRAQGRWRTAFRIVLTVPAWLLTTQLAGGAVSEVGVLSTVAVLGWFVSLVLARMPRGIRDMGVYAVGYRTQLLAYVLLVTERYPDSDPAAMLSGLEPPPPHPVYIVGDAEELRRSRVTVFFRLLLAIPHLVWLTLWTVLVILAGIVQWFVTLFVGRPGARLHAFLSRYVRYSFHVSAFLYLVANPFPGFTGAPGRYPLDLELPVPGRQNRWKTGFRMFLAFPAVLVGSALGGALSVCAFLMWWVGLVKGSAPPGLRNLAAYAIRYQGQLSAYGSLLTDVYPHASPLEGAVEPLVEAPVEAAAA